MRILFLTNFYPPHELGGQGKSCQEVVEGLQERGHSTLVLTSMHGINNIPQEIDGVCRSLYLEMDMVPWRHGITFFTRRKAREKHNLKSFECVYDQFQPDVVFIWGMWNFPRSLPVLVESKCQDKVLYRFAEYWPTLPSQHELYWRTSGQKWYSRFPKKIIGNIALALLAKDNQLHTLNFKHAMCVSAATRKLLVESGVPISNARIIHTGLDSKPYLNNYLKHQLHNENQNLNLLYAGRLSPDKGVDTTIKVMKKLVIDQRQQNIKLSLAGAGSVDYENRLRSLVIETGLTDYVRFLGRIPSQEMPELLRKSDVLLVPSIWPEPFARTVLEGMISGLVVIATPTGGTSEILKDGDNGLLFAPGDAEELAQKIANLITDPKLRYKLAQAGQQTVINRFTKVKMIDKIENYLQEIANGSTSKEPIE